MTPSLVALLLASALPIAGVLFLGWSVFPLVPAVLARERAERQKFAAAVP